MQTLSRNWRVFILIISSTLCFPMGASAQVAGGTSTSEALVSITIHAKDRVVRAGSPVWVDVTEKKNSDKIVPLSRQKPFSMDQGGETFKVDVWNDKGIRCEESTFYRKILGHLTAEEQAQAQPEIGSGSALLVKPGETTDDRIDVGRLYDLSHPGTYRIQIQSPFQSNSISITVTP